MSDASRFKAEEEETAREIERQGAPICENCRFAVDVGYESPWVECTKRYEGDDYVAVLKSETCDMGVGKLGNQYRHTCDDCAYADYNKEGVAHCDLYNEDISMDDIACERFAEEG